MQIYMSNQGHSGHTTVDFLPATRNDFAHAEQAARQLERIHPGGLLFSIMLGTNDSANFGPRGAPLSAEAYAGNLKEIVSQLLREFPESLVMVQRPTWYSPNTYNSAEYLRAGLERLQSYFPAIDSMVRGFARSDPNRVFLGDTLAFDDFSANYAGLTPETGQRGIFYLHPNMGGASALGDFWAAAIADALEAHADAFTGKR